MNWSINFEPLLSWPLLALVLVPLALLALVGLWFRQRGAIFRFAGSPLWVEASLDASNADNRPVRTGDGVSPIMITANDFAGAWAVDENGDPLLPTVPADPMQRVYALRAGVNIMMYMLTGNYKSDQVHVPVLLERLGQ